MYTHHFSVNDKKSAASVSFSQLVDGQHWFIRNQQQTFDYIIAISEYERDFAMFVERLTYSVTKQLYVTRTCRRERALRMTYSTAHALACELSRYHNQETRVESVASASREIA